MPRYCHVYALVSMDVWGNPVDGWEVNNWYRSGAPELRVYTSDPDGPSAGDVWRALKRPIEWPHFLPALRSTGAPIKPGIRRASIGIEWTDGNPDGPGDWMITDERTPRVPATSDGTKVPDYGWSKPVYNLEWIRRE